jgi:hypothetical protein
VTWGCERVRRQNLKPSQTPETKVWVRKLKEKEAKRRRKVRKMRKKKGSIR